MRMQSGTLSRGHAKLIGSTGALACAFSLMLSESGNPVRRSHPQQKTPFQQPADQIGSIFSGIASTDTPGFAVLVKKDGKVVFEKGFGVRDLRTKSKIDARTN